MKQYNTDDTWKKKYIYMYVYEGRMKIKYNNNMKKDVWRTLLLLRVPRLDVFHHFSLSFIFLPFIARESVAAQSRKLKKYARHDFKVDNMNVHTIALHYILLWLEWKNKEIKKIKNRNKNKNKNNIKFFFFNFNKHQSSASWQPDWWIIHSLLR